MTTNTAGTTARELAFQAVHYLRKRITWEDAATTVTIGTIPSGSVIIRGGVVVSTAFNGDTTNTLDIGTVADPNGLATVLALGTIGVIVADEMATTNDAYVTADTVINCAVVSTASASAGVGDVWIEYIPDNDG